MNNIIDNTNVLDFLKENISLSDYSIEDQEGKNKTFTELGIELIEFQYEYRDDNAPNEFQKGWTTRSKHLIKYNNKEYIITVISDHDLCPIGGDIKEKI